MPAPLNLKLFNRGWQEARKLVNMVYEAIQSSKSLQSDYRLKDQSTGAACSAIQQRIYPVFIYFGIVCC
jgi:hypothetical protein